MEKQYVKLGVVLLVSMVIGFTGYKTMSLQRYANEQNYAKIILSEEINQLKSKLPDSNQADLLPKMPIFKSEIWQNTLFYYPSLDLYAYRFLSRYQYDSNGKRTLRKNRQVPDLLERRSVYLKADKGKWRCYATVPSHLRDENCDDREIVRGLTTALHQSAYKIEGNYCVVPLLQAMKKWQLAQKMPIYQIHVFNGQNAIQPAIELKIAKETNALPNQTIVVLRQDEPQFPRDIIISRDSQTHISGLILLGNNIKIYGLPKNTPIIDGTQCPEISNTWKSAFAAWQPEIDSERYAGGETYESMTTNRGELSWLREDTAWENGTFYDHIRKDKP